MLAWAAGWLAVQACRMRFVSHGFLVLFLQRFPRTRCFESVIIPRLVRACIRTDFAPDYPALGQERIKNLRLVSSDCHEWVCANMPEIARKTKSCLRVRRESAHW